jgi:hypothetical protein
VYLGRLTHEPPRIGERRQIRKLWHSSRCNIEALSIPRFYDPAIQALALPLGSRKHSRRFHDTDE